MLPWRRPPQSGGLRRRAPRRERWPGMTWREWRQSSDQQHHRRTLVISRAASALPVAGLGGMATLDVSWAPAFPLRRIELAPLMGHARYCHDSLLNAGPRVCIVKDLFERARYDQQPGFRMKRQARDFVWSGGWSGIVMNLANRIEECILVKTDASQIAQQIANVIHGGLRRGLVGDARIHYLEHGGRAVAVEDQLPMQRSSIDFQTTCSSR